MGVVEEIEEIPRMLVLEEEMPFESEVFGAGLVAPDADDDDPVLEFIYDGTVRRGMHPKVGVLWTLLALLCRTSWQGRHRSLASYSSTRRSKAALFIWKTH